MGFYTSTFRRMAGNAFFRAAMEESRSTLEPDFESITRTASAYFQEAVDSHLKQVILETLPTLSNQDDKIVGISAHCIFDRQAYDVLTKDPLFRQLASRSAR